jgi:anaerobic selenocysteine-containing dehydrogenase
MAHKLLTKRTSLQEHINKYTPQWAENITGIPKEQIIELARLYANTKKACIRFSESPEKADLQAFAMSIAMLIAITGHLDRPGGNVYFYPAVPLRLDTFDKRLSKETLSKTLGHDVFWINVMGGPTEAGADFISVINALITGKPYRPKVGLFFCTNPLSTARNPEKIAEAIEKLELCVVVDVVATPTTRYADIVLPAATRYEGPGDIGIWENHLGFSSQVIKPLWETKPDFQIILDLAVALGMGKDFWYGDCDKMLEEFLDSTLKPIQKRISLKELKKNALKGVYLPVTDWMKKRERYKEHFSMLPNQKVQLYNEFLKKHGYDPLPTYHGEPEDPTTTPELLKEYPLMFTDEHAMYLNHHSWMRNVAWLRELKKHNYVKIHPSTAKKYGIKDGDWVEIESPHGSMKAVAWIFPGIRPDTLIGQHGWWQGCISLNLPETSVFNKGTNVNVLYNWDKRDPITQNITKNTLVRIKKTTPPESVSPIMIKEV